MSGKSLLEMTPKELKDQMEEWFPWLKKPYEPYRIALTKEEKEHEHGWKLWKSDMEEALQYQAEQQLRGKW